MTTEGESTSEGDRVLDDGDARALAAPLETNDPPLVRASSEFPGLADLDEDLRTMSQSNAEVERWRRISTRGLTPAAGTTREGGPLDAPIVSEEAYTAATSPGSLEAPTEHASVGSTLSADQTRKLPSLKPEQLEDVVRTASADQTRKIPSVRPETLAALDAEAARRSFAPPKDAPSAPPGSRVILPRSSQPPARTSSRPVKVPRPSQPPPDPDAEVRGWRASDPSAMPDPTAMRAPQEDEHAVANVAIPRPAPLPGARRAAERSGPEARAGSSTSPSTRPSTSHASAASSPSPTPPSAPSPAPKSAPLAPGERLQLDSPLEVSGALVLGALLVGVVVLFGLAYLVLM